MAVALGTAYTGTFTQATGTTLVGPAITEAAGQWIVVSLVIDNTAAATPTLSSLTKPGGETNSWTILNVNSPTATSSAGLKLALAYIYTTTAWSAFAPTGTWSATAANRTFSAASFSGASPVVRGTAQSAGLTTGAATASLSGANAPLLGDLVVGGMGVEDGQYVNGGVTASPADATGTASFISSGNVAANTRTAGMIGYALSSSVNGTYTMKATTAPTQDNIFAAIAFAPNDKPVNAGFTWTAATSATINATKPTGTAIGDLLVMDYFDNSTVTFTVPSGWTKIGTDQGMGGRCYKIATSTETAASTFAVGNGNGLSTSGVRVTRILAGTFDATNPIDVSNSLQTTVAANPASTGLTIVTANSLVLGVCTATQSTSAAITPPTALLPYDNALTPSMSHAATQAIVATGATGTQTWTGVSTTYLHGLIAIRAIASGSNYNGDVTTAGVGSVVTDSTRDAPGSVITAGLGAVSTAGVRNAVTGNTVSGVGAVSTAADRAIATGFTLTGIGSTAHAARLDANSGITLTGIGAVVAAAVLAVTSGTTITATGTVVTSAVVTRSGDVANVAGVGSVATTATKATAAASTVAGVGTVLTAASLGVPATVTTVTAAGSRAFDATLALATGTVVPGVGSVIVAAQRNANAVSLVSGVGSVVTEASVTGSANADVFVAGVGSVTTAATAARTAATSTTATGTTTHAAQLDHVSATTVSGIGSVVTSAALAVNGATTVTGTGSVLTDAARVAAAPLAAITATGSVTTAAEVVHNAQSGIAGVGAVAQAARLDAAGQTDVTGLGSIEHDGRLDGVAGTSTSAVGTVVYEAVISQVAGPTPPERTYNVPAQDRTHEVDAQVRDTTVPAQTRTYAPPQMTRTYNVPHQNRTVEAP